MIIGVDIYQKIRNKIYVSSSKERKKTIARELGISRNTVKNIVKALMCHGLEKNIAEMPL